MKNIFLSLLLYFSLVNPVLAALAIDGSATNSSATATLTVTLTTAASNDVIILFTHDASASAVTVSSVTDSAGLTWAKRTSTAWGPGGAFEAEEWYATSSGPLTSDVITVVYTAAASHSSRGFAFGINGANTSSPFDSNVSLPATAQVADTTKNISTIISTSNANDMLIGYMMAFGGFGTITYPSGFSNILSGGTSGNPSQSIVSATQSSVTETWSWTGATSARALIVDAVKQASPATPTGLLLNSDF